jgi:hypothetical protein
MKISILVKGYFLTVMRAFFSEAIFLKSRDCFGKKRLAMTHLSTRNEYIYSARSVTTKLSSPAAESRIVIS